MQNFDKNKIATDLTWRILISILFKLMKIQEISQLFKSSNQFTIKICNRVIKIEHVEIDLSILFRKKRNHIKRVLSKICPNTAHEKQIEK